MSSLAPQSFRISQVPPPRATTRISFAPPSVVTTRTGAALLLALASLPAVVLGGRPITTLAAIVGIVGTAVKRDCEHHQRLLARRF